MDIFLITFLALLTNPASTQEKLRHRKITCYVCSRRKDKSQLVPVLIPTPVLQVQKCLEPLGNGLELGNPAKCVSWVILISFFPSCKVLCFEITCSKQSQQLQTQG